MLLMTLLAKYGPSGAPSGAIKAAYAMVRNAHASSRVVLYNIP